jgi:hypothetical protein
MEVGVILGTLYGKENFLGLKTKLLIFTKIINIFIPNIYDYFTFNFKNVAKTSKEFIHNIYD